MSGDLESEAGEFVPERVGPFHGVVRPVHGKTWGDVLSAADLEVTFKAR
jgi:hypothetical protein